MNLSQRDTELRELMDDPHCDPQRLQATLRRFALVNRLVAGWDTVYRARLRPIFSEMDAPIRVLDLGSGGGDVIERLAGLAAREGFDVHWTGADPDPRAFAVAQERNLPQATFVCTDAASLLDHHQRFDVVISNHVLHHLEPQELLEFTRNSRALSSGHVLHSDIARSRLAYCLFAVGITPLAPGTFLRVDGLRSIRRSYWPQELSAALGSEWNVTSPVPFRVIAESSGRA